MTEQSQHRGRFVSKTRKRDGLREYNKLTGSNAANLAAGVILHIFVCGAAGKEFCLSF